MSDDFDGYQKGLESPADSAAAITPDDDTDLEKAPRGIHVGTGGTLVLEMKDHNQARHNVTFHVLGGVTYPFRPSRVLATGTSATNLVAVW